MYKVLGIVFSLCLFQNTIAYCCFRDPWTLPCGCPDIDTCGVITCNPCSSISPCNCGVPTSPCFRDTSNVCFVYENPSPICSCLKSIGECGGECGKNVGCGCGKEKEFIYFPEVEYPAFALEMKPFYYSSCWNV